MQNTSSKNTSWDSSKNEHFKKEKAKKTLEKFTVTNMTKIERKITTEKKPSRIGIFCAKKAAKTPDRIVSKMKFKKNRKRNLKSKHYFKEKPKTSGNP